MSYAELQVTTHFSFLRGASSPRELFATAALLGIPALGISDRHSVAGLVHAHEAAKTTGVRLIPGCRVDLVDGPPLLLYPTNRIAYGRMCRLLTLGKSRAGKGHCHVGWDDVAAWNDGLIAILLTHEPDKDLQINLARTKEIFDDRGYCSLIRRFLPNDVERLDRIAELAGVSRVPTVVTGDVLYHHPSRRMLQDVVTCIRLGTTMENAGFQKERHANRYLNPPQEVVRLYPEHRDAVARSLEIAVRCRFSLDQLRYNYPTEVLQDGLTAQQRLEKLTWEGATSRYPDGVPENVVTQIRHELTIIERLDYAPYFLTVDSIVRFARSKNILCQGRGSAANSAVCFALGITAIDPVRQGLLFERFISEERREPPDIDVDFEHERREEVIQWIYETYGREHAALTCTFSRYRARGAVREVGKALGLPEDVTAALAGLVWGWSREGIDQERAKELNLNLEDRRLALTLELSKQLIDAPRHLSQHPGGFVLSLHRLDELVPIEPAAMENRQVIEWDKDDIDALGFMKVDVLGLGMLGCMRRAFDLLQRHKGIKRDLANVPPEDKKTFEMIQKADTIGVFQIESRAQMAMLPRLKPARFYDLVIEVAIVRPGPIQGDMVHPYIRRREGKEEVTYPTHALKRVLEKTLGVPLFQEQAMQVAIVAAGFTPTEADNLRRSMATFKFTGGVDKFRDKLIDGMRKNGYARDYAERTFKQIEGFGSYGFPESHAASFALIAYASSWMKRHHPDVFLCAILNAQPMGFYAPAQLVRDARQHGVEVRSVDINHSEWESTLEPYEDGFAVRLGLRLTRGLFEKDGRRIAEMRGERAYVSVGDLWRRAGVPIAALQHLAKADAFRSLNLRRRDAAWAIKALRDEPMPLFAAADKREMEAELREPAVELPAMTVGREVVEDYRTKGLTLRPHPLSFLRADLTQRGFQPCATLKTTPQDRRISIAGLVLVRQMPGSAHGVIFITLEDETEIGNLVVWPAIFEKYRRTILSSTMLGCRGKVQREGDVIHLVAEHLINLSTDLHRIGQLEEGMPVPVSRGDHVSHPGGPDQRERVGFYPDGQDIYIPDQRLASLHVKSRNFH